MTDGPILVTGAAGFIGFHVAKRLLRDGRDVVGLDNTNAYSNTFDAVLISNLFKPRETREAAVSRFGVERVLVPELLRVRIGQRSEPKK